MMDRGAAMGHDDEGSFAIEIVDEELEEGVDGKSLQRPQPCQIPVARKTWERGRGRTNLVDISDRIKECSSLERYHAHPRADGVDGNPRAASERGFHTPPRGDPYMSRIRTTYRWRSGLR